MIDSKSAELRALCRRHRVRTLDVFGSAVRGGFDPETSDLDFVVEFDALPPGEAGRIYFGLKSGLETLFGRPVDLVVDSAIENPYFRASVDASRRTVYEA